MQYFNLRSSGQVLAGDKLILINREGKIQRATVRDVINPNTSKEEIIINKSRNLYFITSMVLDHTSWVRCAAYACVN